MDENQDGCSWELKETKWKHSITTFRKYVLAKKDNDTLATHAQP